MTRSIYNETGFNFAADLAKEYFLETESILGMEEEIKLIRKELDSRPIPSGYKKLELSENMDRVLQAGGFLSNYVTKEIFSFLDTLINQKTGLSQEARTIQTFICANSQSFLY